MQSLRTFGWKDSLDRKTTLLVLLLSIVVLGIELLTVFWTELNGRFDDDALIYFAMGRGILNGLIPYRDLFETKPPGIFVLSALSLKLGGTLFAKLMQIIALATIPCSLIVAARRILSPVEEGMHHLLFLLACVLGLLLSLYAETFSGGFQVESLGAAVTMLYLSLVALAPDWWGWKRMIVGSICIAVAVMLKEPFILVIGAGNILLANKPASIVTTFALPAAFAAIVILLMLTVSGSLTPYLFYLQYMLTQGTTLFNGPLLLRPFLLHQFLEHALAFSPLFVLLLPVLIGSVLAVVCKNHRELRTRIAWTARIVVALYLAFLAVGTGGDFFGHHFVFALPVYGALVLLLMREARRDHSSVRPWTLLPLITLTVLTALFHTRTNPLTQVQEWRTKETQLQHAAMTIDTVLDRCGVDRYLYLVQKGRGPFGFTRHSPMGPVFINHDRLLTRSDSPFHVPVAAEMRTAEVVVLENFQASGLTDKGWQFVAETYTESAPTCAGTFEQPLPYRILFRRQR